MTRTTTVLALVLLASSLTHAAPKQPRIPVYLFTATDPSGFTNQAAQDCQRSIADALKILRRSDVLVAVPTREEAVIVLEITRRVKELTRQTMAQSILGNNSSARSPDSLQPYLYGTLTVADYTTELRSKETEGEGKSLQLMIAMADWVRANRAQLAPLLEADPIKP
jgi:hypothetical protein